jgi:hypothetical protein
VPGVSQSVGLWFQSAHRLRNRSCVGGTPSHRLQLSSASFTISLFSKTATIRVGMLVEEGDP